MPNRFDHHGGASWHALALCTLMLIAAHGAASATQRIGAAELLSPAWSGGVISNTAFTPPSDAVTEHAPFLGTLQIDRDGDDHAALRYYRRHQSSVGTRSCFRASPSRSSPTTAISFPLLKT